VDIIVSTENAGGHSGGAIDGDPPQSSATRRRTRAGALLEQEGGLATPSLRRRGSPPTFIAASGAGVGRLPKVTGAGGGPADQVYVTGRLNRLFVEAEDEAKRLKDEYVSGNTSCWRSLTTKALLGESCPNGRYARTADPSVARGSRQPAVTTPTPETTYQSLERYGPGSDRGGTPRQARSGNRPRRRDSSRHSGAVPPYQNNPVRSATWRGEDRDRGRISATNRRGDVPEGIKTSGSSRWIWAR